MKATKLMDFHPKFFEAMKHYSREKFTADVMAGIIVGIVAIPLAIAFGIASGVGPTEGLVTAIMAGFLISVFGGSKVQIGGPTGAFIVIVYGAAVWTERTCDCYYYGRYNIGYNGIMPFGKCNKVYAISHNHRFYRWYCNYNLLDTD